MRQFLNVKSLINKFQTLKHVAGGSLSLEREITSGLIIQPGFEMAGFMFPEFATHIYLFGQREKKYANYAMSKKQMEKVFSEFLEYKPICFIFDHDYICPEIVKQLANKYGVAVLQVAKHEFSISYHLQNFLSQQFAPTIDMHASCLSIFGCGVLIQGVSGIGKSESTLELIKKKHLFVSDDRVVLKRIGNDLFASSPKITQGFIEVRGIGILDVKRMFGIHACTNNIKINLITKLVDWKINEDIDRLGDTLFFQKLLNVNVQYYQIPVRQGRSVSELIETAVISFLLRKEGINSTTELNNRLKKLHLTKTINNK